MRTKILLLFGAGASNEKGGIIKSPPVNRGLFKELSERFPETWGNKAINIYKDEFERNFEYGMEKLKSHSPKLLLLEYVRDMGIFFSGYRIANKDNNLYYNIVKKYLNQLRSNEIVIATTNYDCLIELALRLVVLNLEKKILEDWLNNDGIKILKIHGSCNYLPTERTRQMIKGPGKIILETEEARVVTDLEAVNPIDVEDKMKYSQFAPAMSLYARGKNVLVGREQIADILANFHKYIKDACLAFVIGLHPNKEDGHIWDYLETMNGKLILVNPDEDCKDWTKDKTNSEWWNKEFGLAFSEICNRIDSVL